MHPRTNNKEKYLWIVFLDPSDTRNLCQPRNGRRVVPQRIFVRREGMLEVAHLLGNAAWGAGVSLGGGMSGYMRTDEKPCLLVGDVELVEDGGGDSAVGDGGGDDLCAVLLGGCGAVEVLDVVYADVAGDVLAVGHCGGAKGRHSVAVLYILCRCRVPLFCRI